jgi:hypothetical protein
VADGGHPFGPQSNSTIPTSFNWDKLAVMFRPASAFIQVAALAAAALCLEASRTPSLAKPSFRETPQAITATIFRLEQALDEAESNHRVDKVQELIADDYRGHHRGRWRY